MGGLIGRRWWKFGVWVFLGAPVWVAAASVTGEVYDVRTGKVVPRATVTLEGETAVSGPDGLFKLLTAPRKPSLLVAKAPGYAVTVIKYLPVVPTPEEIWQNVPLLPRDTATPYEGDFVELFFENAPLERQYKGNVLARRFEDLPLTVAISPPEAAKAVIESGLIEGLNERWATGILAAGGEESADIYLDFEAPGGVFNVRYENGRRRASFPGGPTEENLDTARAFLRRTILAGRLDGPAEGEERLRADGPLAEDLDAVIEIIYRERNDFNYAVFKRRSPSSVSILADLYLGIGGYGDHGVTDERGDPVEFPIEYQMGQVSVAFGAAYRNVWGKAGVWFAGIWEPDAERFYESGGEPAEKVLRRNFSLFYRGGARFTPTGGVRVGPVAGYRELSIRGKFAGTERPEGALVPADLDYTTRYDGFEAGVAGEVALKWHDVGFFGEYVRVFAAEPYNLAEAGLGAVSRPGAGTFAFVRFYWGGYFRYSFGGLAMKLAIPL